MSEAHARRKASKPKLALVQQPSAEAVERERFALIERLVRQFSGTLTQQRETLEYIARNFEIVSGGSVDNPSANVLASIATMLGTFCDLQDHILTLRSMLPNRGRS